jgi:predicted NBD/HSP70 family sugar kinase/biotin operon repressor
MQQNLPSTAAGMPLAAQRTYKERAALTLLRRCRQLPKAELARMMGLSATAAGSLVKQLEDDGLVLRGEPQRGKVGQPSVPYRINPDGSFAFGLKIGRRSVELVLLNALMEVVAVAQQEHPYPIPEQVVAFAQTQTRALLAQLGQDAGQRVCGLGIATPYDLWNWIEEMSAPPGALDVWRGVDIAREWPKHFDYPLLVANDATSACAAELAMRSDSPTANALYFFVGWFVGGGVVLNGRVFEGGRNNAGALGSMPVSGPDGRPTQLIRVASLYTLERELVAKGESIHRMWQPNSDWDELDMPLEEWLERAAPCIAQAIAAASSVIDFDTAIIDGSMPEAVRQRLLEKVRAGHAQLDLQGLSVLEIQPGRVGRNARAIGAASLLLLNAYAAELGEPGQAVTG